MGKKYKYAVTVSYIVDVEAETDYEALRTASFEVEFSPANARSVHLGVCHRKEVQANTDAVAITKTPYADRVTGEPFPDAVSLPPVEVAPVTAAEDIPF